MRCEVKSPNGTRSASVPKPYAAVSRKLPEVQLPTRAAPHRCIPELGTWPHSINFLDLFGLKLVTSNSTIQHQQKEQQNQKLPTNSRKGSLLWSILGVTTIWWLTWSSCHAEAEENTLKVVCDATRSSWNQNADANRYADLNLKTTNERRTECHHAKQIKLFQSHALLARSCRSLSCACLMHQQ